MKKIVRLFIYLFCCAALALACDSVPENPGGENPGEQVPGEGENPDGGEGEEPDTPVEPPIGDLVITPVSPNTNYTMPTLGTLSTSNLTASNHPRVIFTQADFDAIKKSIADKTASPVLAEFHDQIITLANSYCGAATLVYGRSDGKRMLELAQTALARLCTCAYAYKTTGLTKYKEQVIKDLETVCNSSKFPDWNSQKHFLDTGELAAGVALAYDWLYSDLSSSQKTSAVNALKNNAFTPAERQIWNLNFYTAVGNWNQVCNGGLIAGALAVYENVASQAKKIIQKGVESNLKIMESLYAPDGNYPEGYSYWGYGTMYQVFLMTVLETATGSDLNLSKVPGFDKTGHYMLHMEGTCNLNFNFSDCTSSVGPAVAQWYFAHKFNDTSVLYIEKNRLGQYRTSDGSRMLPLLAYYAYKLNIPSLRDVPAPTDNIYVGHSITPVLLVHDNWAMDATDKYLAMKGGKGSTSHAHLDAGSFVYESQGVRWASDPPRPSYSVSESQYSDFWSMTDGSGRWKIREYNNLNHNTLTANGKYHPVAGAAKITGMIDTPDRKGGVIDMTKSLGGEVASAIRTIYMEKDDLVVTDEIKAKSGADVDIQWTLISTATPGYFGADIELDSGVGKFMYLKKSSATGHSARWFLEGNSKCGYKVSIKKGETAKITIRFTTD